MHGLNTWAVAFHGTKLESAQKIAKEREIKGGER